MDHLRPEIFSFAAHDGTILGMAVYKPKSSGPFPVLFAASPYRFDNNILPASQQFLWRETGPVELYVENGYAFAHLDVRGSGRSGGEYEFLGNHEQLDLCDAVNWIAQQPWCCGAIGGIGQSYYSMLQWFLGAMAPPALKCIAPHDGLNDPYRANVYHGGIPCDFFPGYWWYQNRFINRFPAAGPPREQNTDLSRLISEHPLYDGFWRERCAWEKLDRIRIPLYSGGVWAKMMLHTRGNIDGYVVAGGPKKLRMSAAPNAWAANAEFNSADFHRRVYLPFYDHYLKGLDTDYASRPNVEYAVRGSTAMRSSATWPPGSTDYRTFYLDAKRTGSVTSLNDGSLGTEPGRDETSYSYPDPGWVSGVVGFGPHGPPGGFDGARRVLTFTSRPLTGDLEICGPIKLVLFVSSSARDTDFFVKLADQSPQNSSEREKGLNPPAELVTRGWLRASHRKLDPGRSSDMVSWHSHTAAEPLTPHEVYRFDISLEPMAYLFRKDHRIRLEIANGDSPATELLWPHYYRPDKIGRDTVHHSPAHPSHLILPVT